MHGFRVENEYFIVHTCLIPSSKDKDPLADDCGRVARPGSRSTALGQTGCFRPRHHFGVEYIEAVEILLAVASAKDIQLVVDAVCCVTRPGGWG
jgi:hypothetical protein